MRRRRSRCTDSGANTAIIAADHSNDAATGCCIGHAPLSAPGFYYHFQSKGDLLAALLEPADELIRELLQRLEATSSIDDWGDALEWVVGAFFDHIQFFQLVERNRAVVANLDTFGGADHHQEMHRRIEAAVRKATPVLREQVRMIAALGAVTGFDDWAPRLMGETEPAQLRTELVAAMRDTLGLRARARSRTRAKA